MAYITDLERRLSETEAALYTALDAIEDRGDRIESLPLRWHAKSTVSGGTSRSKAERQYVWKQQPLQSKEQLAAWFQNEKSHGQYLEQDGANVEGPRSSSHRRIRGREHGIVGDVTTARSPSQANVIPSTPLSTSHHASEDIVDNIFDHLGSFETAHTPITSQGQGAVASQWRNYF